MILFVTQPSSVTKACGVHLIGMQYLEALQSYSKYEYKHASFNSIDELRSEITASQPLAVIINYHIATTPWVNINQIKHEFPNVPFIKIEHDFRQSSIDNYTPETNQGFNYAICLDTTLRANHPNVFHINRLMAHGTPTEGHENHVPVIGYQGFGFDHKGIPLIAEQAVKEFDHAILKMHIPNSYYGDPLGHLATKQLNIVLEIIKGTNVNLIFSTKMMTSEQLVAWLSQNDVNCYFYHDTDDFGVASAPDYAIAARKPIAVKQTSQLRYVWQNVPQSIVDNSSLKNIISNGFAPFELLYNKMKIPSVVKEIDNAIQVVLERNRTL